MMCCDGCTLSFHLRCVSMRTVPDGDWYCEQCRAERSEKQALLARRRQKRLDQAREREADMGVFAHRCEICGQSWGAAWKLERHMKKHQRNGDTGNKRSPLGSRATPSDAAAELADAPVTQQKQSELQARNEEGQTTTSDDEHDDVCNICDKGGGLLCCDGCTLAFHLPCIGSCGNLCCEGRQRGAGGRGGSCAASSLLASLVAVLLRQICSPRPGVQSDASHPVPPAPRTQMSHTCAMVAHCRLAYRSSG